VYYLLTFAIIAAVIRRLTPPRALLALTVAVVLQAVDTSGAYRDSRHGRRPTEQDGLRSEVWGVAPRHYRHLVLHPTNMCSATAIDWRAFAIRAGRAGITLNAGFAARYDASKVRAYCHAFAAYMKAGNAADDELYVLFPRLAPDFARAADKRVACTLVDGHAICFTADSYLRWQDHFDVTRSTLPEDTEFLEFRKALEVEYRDRMQRPVRTVRGSSSERLRLLASYLAYRSRNCGAEEAADKVLAALRHQTPVRLCQAHALVPQRLPPRNETMDFHRQLDAVLGSDLSAEDYSTHVDFEGEVVWVQEYAQARLDGLGHVDATNRVLAQIHALAPSGSRG
jgi:hypothetical protein